MVKEETIAALQPAPRPAFTEQLIEPLAPEVEWQFGGVGMLLSSLRKGCAAAIAAASGRAQEQGTACYPRRRSRRARRHRR